MHRELKQESRNMVSTFRLVPFVIPSPYPITEDQIGRPDLGIQIRPTVAANLEQNVILNGIWKSYLGL